MFKFLIMAGMQSCLRKVLGSNSFKHVRKYDVFQYPITKKKYITYAAAPLKNLYLCKGSANSHNLYIKYLYRYSSTATVIEASGLNVSDKRADILSSVPSPEASTSSVASVENNNSATEILNDSPINATIFIDESSLPPVPKVPVENLNINEIIETVSTTLQEPTFASLGLNSYWPTGWIHRFLEFLHINCDLPWWAAIATVTLILRILIFPLNIKAKKHSINMHNHMPQMQVLQMKINEARLTGNYFDTARYLQELQIFLKEKNIGTAGAFLPMLAQMPIFLSMFWGIRKMTTLPVESMKTGGCLWFPDFTIPDPYYILPIIISTTMALIIETGAEGASTTNLSIYVKYAFRAMPWVLFPFSIYFPSAMQSYWVVSNSIALSQTLILKIPFVKNYLDLPVAIKHDPKSLPLAKKKGYKELKETFVNMKLINEIQERERLNTVTFEKAGTGPVPRTFKHNPTKMEAASHK